MMKRYSEEPVVSKVSIGKSEEELRKLKHRLHWLAVVKGLAVAKRLIEIGYVVKHVEFPAIGETIIDLTNPELEHSLINKGLYKEVAYLESTGSIHITPYRIEGEIPHAPPIAKWFRERLFAAKCQHTAHVSPNAVHEHFICPLAKLNLILNLAEEAFKYAP